MNLTLFVYKNNNKKHRNYLKINNELYERYSNKCKAKQHNSGLEEYTGKLRCNKSSNLFKQIIKYLDYCNICINYVNEITINQSTEFIQNNLTTGIIEIYVNKLPNKSIINKIKYKVKKLNEEFLYEIHLIINEDSDDY